MMVRWLTGCIDRPVNSFRDAARFWATVTGSSLSPSRGESHEFATLVPPDGDPYLCVRRAEDGTGVSHLAVHVDELDAFARHAVSIGADEHDRSEDGAIVLRSPAGLPWRIVGHHGEADRPAPRPAGSNGRLHLVDQLCIDIPTPRFNEECEFWSHLTGWELRQSPIRPEFRYLVRPDEQPLRLLLQRCDGPDGSARAHLDLASDDVTEVVAHHVSLGATVTAKFEHWTVMTDPSGHAYCVTARHPQSGPLSVDT